MTTRTSGRQASIVLTERDHALLAEIARMHLLTREHLVALGFFNSTSRANARLAQLRKTHFVVRLRPPLGMHPGFGIYRIGRAGASVLVKSLGGGLEEATKLTAPSSPLLLVHTLAVADCRIALSRLAPCQVWKGEAECFHRYSVRKCQTDPWMQELLRPDGYAELQVEGSSVSAFIEVDLGHVSLPRIADKLAHYATYRSSGLYRRTYRRDDFLVIIATTGIKRLSHLQSIAARQPDLATRFCLLDELKQGSNWLFDHAGKAYTLGGRGVQS